MDHSLDAEDWKELRKLLYSAVLSDVLDDLGWRRQTLDPGLVPLDSGLVLMGRAFTAIAAEVSDIPAEPYKLQMEAVDAIGPEEVFVVQTGGSDKAAFWGELLSTACRARGGTGAVVDGLCRDTRRIREMGFPVYARGTRPADSKGRLDVIAYQVPVEIGGVRIEPGDILFGDSDGITVVPRQAERQAIELALAKATGENGVRAALQNGMLCSEAFRTFGIL